MADNPILQYGDDLDNLAITQEARRYAPFLATIASRLKRLVRTEDHRTLLTAFDAEMPKLHDTLVSLIAAHVRHAVRQSREAARQRYEQEYGHTNLRQILRVSAGSADDVVDRILHLPDQWGYTYSQRIWSNLQGLRQDLTGFMSRHIREKASLMREAEALRKWQLNDR